MRGRLGGFCTRRHFSSSEGELQTSAFSPSGGFFFGQAVKTRIFIYTSVILLSSYIGYLLGNTFCVISNEGSCLTSVLTYIAVINGFNLVGVFILVNLSEKSITEWNQNLEEE